MFAEKIGESCSTTGTGTFSLGGAYGVFRTWLTGFSTGDVVFYYATNDAGSIWELGYGTLTSGSPATLTRTLIASSSGALINWAATFRIYSIPSATAMKHMLTPLQTAKPAWLPSGALWLDYALGYVSGAANTATAWIKKLWNGTVDIEEGRAYMASGIYAASQRMLFVDIGAAGYTFTINDIGKCLCFDTSAASRALTLLTAATTGMGHGAYFYVLPYGANPVTIVPGGSDSSDIQACVPGRITKVIWDGAKSVWRADAQASVIPQGRLTLATATPVMTSAQTAKTTVYYTPYLGNLVSIPGASGFVAVPFAELSNDLTASSTGKAGPAAATTNSNYDLFVWNDAGTLRLTRGPAWSSDTSRGTGAATTEIERISGLWRNKVAITNGPGAGLGLYVGTIRTDGSSQANWQPGGAAAGGTAALLNVWNAYNRVFVSGVVSDTTASWNYTTFTWRSADNSTGNRVSFIVGLQEDFISACYQVGALNSSGNSFNAGIGYDSTTAPSGVTGAGNSTVQTEIMARCQQQPLGFHYFQALELSAAVGTSTWYGVFNTQVAGLDYSGRF